MRETGPILRGGPQRASALLTLLTLALVLAACGGNGGSAGGGNEQTQASPPAAQEQGPTSLRIAFVPATTSLPLHVAQEQGFFEDNDLDVTLTAAANISDIPATLGRQFDLAIGTATDLIRAGAAGLDVVQVSGNTVSTKDNPFVRVVAPADSGIKSFGDLAGKTVGSPTLSGVIHVGTLHAAKQQGADPATIKGVQAPPPSLPDQLNAGKVDAIEALEPFATSLVKAGNVSLGDPFSQIADPLATNFFIAQGEWARANTDAVARFVQSLEQAVEFIEQSPKEARTVLQGFTMLPPPVAQSVPLPTYDVEIRQEDLDRWVEVLRDVEGFDDEVDTSELVLSEQ